MLKSKEISFYRKDKNFVGQSEEYWKNVLIFWWWWDFHSKHYQALLVLVAVRVYLQCSNGWSESNNGADGNDMQKEGQWKGGTSNITTGGRAF